MSVLLPEDLREYLNISDSSQDDELQLFINAAESALAQRVGPLAATTLTYQVAGCSDTLTLPVTPAIALTSVTPINAPALTLSDLTLNTSTGLVTFLVGGWFGARSYTVVYAAGRVDVPDDLQQAEKVLIKHLWKSQRTRASDDTPTGFSLPNAVVELIQPHVRSGLA